MLCQFHGLEHGVLVQNKGKGACGNYLDVYKYCSVGISIPKPLQLYLLDLQETAIG